MVSPADPGALGPDIRLCQTSSSVMQSSSSSGRTTSSLGPEPVQQGPQQTYIAQAFAQVVTSMLRLKYEVPMPASRLTDVVKAACQCWDGDNVERLCMEWNQASPFVEDNGTAFQMRVACVRVNFEDACQTAHQYAGTSRLIVVYFIGGFPSRPHAVAGFDFLNGEEKLIVCVSNLGSTDMYVYLGRQEIEMMYILDVEIVKVMRRGARCGVPQATRLYKQKERGLSCITEGTVHELRLRAEIAEQQLDLRQKQVDALSSTLQNAHGESCSECHGTKVCSWCGGAGKLPVLGGYSSLEFMGCKVCGGGGASFGGLDEYGNAVDHMRMITCGSGACSKCCGAQFAPLKGVTAISTSSSSAPMSSGSLASWGPRSVSSSSAASPLIRTVLPYEHESRSTPLNTTIRLPYEHETTSRSPRSTPLNTSRW